MRHIDSTVKYYQRKRQQVKEALEKEFGSRLAGGIIYSGSVAKSTEVNIKFDVDQIVPFARNSFSTLEEMADALYAFFYYRYKDPDEDRFELKKQRYSTGLVFHSLTVGNLPMDIVAGRGLRQGQYREDGYLNLYDSSEKTSFQTNISLQIEEIRKSHDSVRNIIRLLKVWKYHSRASVKSIFLELITRRAFDNAGKSVPGDLWGQLKMTMEFVRDQIKTIRLEDPGNSNNNVADTLNTSEKDQYSNQFRFMLSEIARDKGRLAAFFSDNIKYCGR